MTGKTILKIIGYYLLFTVGLFLILFGVNWYLMKQQAARLGMARPNFPYTKYTQEELNKMYPQYPNENVPTRQTPEETYGLLRTYLKSGDIELAKELFTITNRERFYQAMKKAKDVNDLVSIFNRLPEKMTKDEKESYGTFAQYKFEDGGIVIFVKDSNGVWRIDSL